MAGVELYGFRPREGLVLAPWEAEELASTPPGASRVVEVNLGRDKAVASAVESEVAVNVAGRTVYRVERSLLERASSLGSRAVWVSASGEARVLELRSGGYYKILPVRGAPPTLEIDGIHMHRIWGTDPLRDTLAKMRAARVRRGHRVLDTCMGLGYTAILSLRRGAAHVVTIEVDDNVIALAEYNPWSRDLASDGIDVVRGDAARVVWELREGYFDRVIHDPPRLSPRTGDLYGAEFYSRLYELLRPGGVLFHYTGEPGKRRRLGVPGHVAGRLQRVGFRVVGFDEEAKGVVAVKPR